MANVPTASWDEESYKGSVTKVNQIDNYHQDLKTQIREVIGVDHKMESSGQGSTWGYHTTIHFIEASASPGAVEDIGQLYTKNDGGDTELYFVGYNNSEIQITKDGKLNNSALSGVAILSQDETVTGFWTFSGDVPWINSAPTSGGHAVRKDYVDGLTLTDFSGVDTIGSAGTVLKVSTDGSSFTFGPWCASTAQGSGFAFSTDHLNSSYQHKWLVVATAHNSTDGSDKKPYVLAKIGNASPATITTAMWITEKAHDGDMEAGTVTFVVPARWYFRLEKGSDATGTQVDRVIRFEL